jgi:hypothetical protein
MPAIVGLIFMIITRKKENITQFLGWALDPKNFDFDRNFPL